MQHKTIQSYTNTQYYTSTNKTKINITAKLRAEKISC